MTAGEITQYLSLALAALAVLGHAKGYFSSDAKALTGRMDVTESTLADLDRRTQVVEGELRHLPDRDSQHRIELQLAEINGRFAAFEERLKPIAAMGERMHEVIMERVK